MTRRAPVAWVVVEATMADGSIVRLEAREMWTCIMKVQAMGGRTTSGIHLTGHAALEVTGYDVLMHLEHAEHIEQESFPAPINGEDPTRPVGLVVSEDEELINWRGVNYVRQAAESDG